MRGLLIAVASLIAEHGLQGTQASVAGAHGLISCASRALGHRLHGSGTQSWLLCGVWDPLGSHMEPESPALTGRLFTSEPTGKPHRAASKSSSATDFTVRSDGSVVVPLGFISPWVKHGF